MSQRRRWLWLAVVAMGWAGLPQTNAHAGGSPVLWTGAAGDKLWHNKENWDPNQVPTANDDVEFPDIIQTQVILDADPNDPNAPTVVRSIHFVGLGYAVGTSCCVLSTTAGITADSGQTTLSVPLLFETVQTVHVQSASAELVLNNAISGAGGLKKTGDGTLTFLSGQSNAYAGETLIEAGVLSIDMPGQVAIPGDLTVGKALGSPATVQCIRADQIADSSHVTVIDQGQLDLLGNSDTIGPLSMTGGEIATGAGTLTLGGNVDATSFDASNAARITGNVSFGSATRTFTIDIGAANSTGDMTIGGSNRGRISGSLSAGIIKTGSGSLRFGGTGAGNFNTYPGPTTVNEGTLILAKANSAVAIPGALQIGDGTGGVDADVVRVTTANQLSPSLTAAIASSGWLDLTVGTASTLSSVTLSGGHIKTLAGALVLSSLSSQASSQQALVEGNLNLAGAPTNFVTAAGAADVAVNVSATLLGSNDLVKAGPGRLELSGDSPSFTGNMTVSEGSLRLTSATGLGAPAPGTTVSAGAGLELLGSITVVNEDLTLNGLGFGLMGALHVLAGDPHWNGNITFASDSVVTVDGGLTLETDRIVTGSAGMFKSGSGRFNLQGKNWSGGTTIQGGTLGLRSISAGSAGLITVLSGSTLEFLLGVVGEGTLSLAGTGVGGSGALKTVSGASNWLGDVVLSANATVNVASASALDFNGAITGGSELTKTGTGILTIGGNTANTYTGATRVVQGELDLNKIGVNAIGGDLFVGNSVRGHDRGAGVVVKWLGSRPEQVIDSSKATLFADGKLDLTLFSPGAHETICQLVNNGGVVDDPTNALIENGECLAPVPQSTPAGELLLVLGLALAAVLRVRRTVRKQGAFQ